MNDDKKLGKDLIALSRHLITVAERLDDDWKKCSEYSRLLLALDQFMRMCECVGDDE